MIISNFESEVYKLCFARTNIESYLSSEQLITSLYENQIDICRIQIPTVQLSQLSQMQNSGLWNNVYNINNYNKIQVPKSVDLKSFTDYTYVQYTEDSFHTIDMLVEDAVKNKGWNNNISQFAQPYMSLEKEIKATQKWVRGFSNSKDKALHLLKYKSEIIGFFTGLKVSEGEFYGGIYSIYDKFRNQGHAKAIYYHTLDYCSKSNYSIFSCSIGHSNIKSQKSATKSGMIIAETHISLEIYPFFSKISNSISTTYDDRLSLDQIILTHFKKGLKILSVKTLKVKTNSASTSSAGKKLIVLNEHNNKTMFVVLFNTHQTLTIKYCVGE